MILFKKGAEMASWARQQRAAGRQIGFVPTMGALHEGHISLIGLSKNALPLTVCSIFVNPTQFNDPRDFQKYPVTIENDIYMLEAAGADVLFLPEADDLYPGGLENLEIYALGSLETLWEGKFRPGHFQGVCQVVRRLLDQVQPDHLFMGRKDYQQCLVIRRLLELTGSKVTLHTGPIVREADGLAMSSRNQRLTADERAQAPAIYRALSWLKDNWRDGKIAENLSHARGILEENGLRPDYIAIADEDSLEPLQEGKEQRMREQKGKGQSSKEEQGKEQQMEESPGKEQQVKERAVALVAAYLGEVRLIDNLFLNGKA